MNKKKQKEERKKEERQGKTRENEGGKGKARNEKEETTCINSMKLRTVNTTIHKE